jgi:Protein of unknown function (DUF3349)
MTLPTVLSSIVDWLRAGYPDGVPDQDYFPLLALLARRLSDDEVAEVAAHLISDQSVSSDDGDIRDLITQITNQPPRREDVDRVRARLHTTGAFL